MLERHCTLGRVVLAMAILVAVVPGTAQAQTVIEGYQVTLSKFGGDATLPTDLGFLCLWDDGIWTLTDYIDVGFFFIVGKKTYLLGGVEGEEHLSMVFKKKRGDLILGGPANSTELPGQDLMIVASAKFQRRDLGCLSREARTTRTLISQARFVGPVAPRSAR